MWQVNPQTLFWRKSTMAIFPRMMFDHWTIPNNDEHFVFARKGFCCNSTFFIKCTKHLGRFLFCYPSPTAQLYSSICNFEQPYFFYGFLVYFKVNVFKRIELFWSNFLPKAPMYRSELYGGSIDMNWCFLSRSLCCSVCVEIMLSKLNPQLEFILQLVLYRHSWRKIDTLISLFTTKRVFWRIWKIFKCNKGQKDRCKILWLSQATLMQTS